MLTVLTLATALVQEKIEITVLDAGNANCIIANIPYGDGHVQAVFDAGTELGMSGANVEKVWARFQEVMGDEEDIELLVVSHVDWDHTSLLTRVLDKYEVDLAFYPDRKDALTSATWKTIHAKIEDEVRIPIPAGTDGSYLGKRFLIGDASFRILTGYNVPPSSYGIAATESKKSEYNNAASIVARLAYWGKSVLFMGDSYGGPDGEATDEPKWGEGDILAKQPDYLVRSDVIVAGHHGANNASFIDFIDKVRPTFVVFASGHGHDHPRKATADRFFKTRASDDKKVSAANVFRTDRDDPREDPAKEWQGGHGPTNGSDRFDDEIVIEMVRGEAVKVKYAKATS